MGAPEASLTPGTQAALLLLAMVRRVHEPGTLHVARRAVEYQMPGGQVLPLLAGEATVLPADAPGILRQALADAAAFWAPTRCQECIRFCVPCEDCAGDPGKARMYGLLADALEGRPAGPLWERAGPVGRVSVRVVMTGPGREPLVSGKENAGPAEAAGFLRGWADEIERAASRGGGSE